MADFKISFQKTMANEGGYTKDPNDAGGETYAGISRVYNPNWNGWKIIDSLKTKPNFPKSLDSDTTLHEEICNFYQQQYWDVNRLTEVKSQKIADEMFDTGVNLGVKRASKFLQEALNYLNRNGQSYPDLVVDGVIGKASLDALDYIIQHSDEEILLKIMNVLQGMHYLNYMKQSPTQEKYTRGWFSRVSL